MGLSSAVAWYHPVSLARDWAWFMASSTIFPCSSITASYAIICASLPTSTSLGTIAWQIMPALAEYAASEAPIFPFVAHIVASACRSSA